MFTVEELLMMKWAVKTMRMDEERCLQEYPEYEDTGYARKLKQLEDKIIEVMKGA